MKEVRVEWVDSEGCSGSWRHKKEVMSDLRDTKLCRSRGLLAHVDALYVLIVPHDAPRQDGHDDWQGEMIIPRGAIVRIVELGESCDLVL